MPPEPGVMPTTPGAAGAMPPGAPPPPTPPPTTPPDKPPPEPTPEELKAELERTREALTKANNEAAERRRKLADIEKQEQERQRQAQADADKQLAEQQKFKELADQRANQIATLEAQLKTAQESGTTLTAKLERYEAALKESVAAQVKDVPKHLLSLLERLEPDEQLKWLAANRDKLVTTPKGGVPPTPAPGGNGPTEAELETARKLAEAQARSTF